MPTPATSNILRIVSLHGFGSVGSAFHLEDLPAANASTDNSLHGAAAAVYVYSGLDALNGGTRTGGTGIVTNDRLARNNLVV